MPRGAMQWEEEDGDVSHGHLSRDQSRGRGFNYYFKIRRVRLHQPMTGLILLLGRTAHIQMIV
jgi:hypothetical protein